MHHTFEIFFSMNALNQIIKNISEFQNGKISREKCVSTMHITQLLPSIVNYFIRTLSNIEKTYESIWMLLILVVNMRYCTFVFLCMFFMRVKSLQMVNDRVCILSIIIFCFFLCGKQKTINEYK